MIIFMSYVTCNHPGAQQSTQNLQHAENVYVGSVTNKQIVQTGKQNAAV